ncbi:MULTISPECIES: universal stress protein [Natrialbaceae]|uniref:universal stress protein n=1 Tax=Natrialbaceae TaxID=1644061 RepID=UPI00207C2321|nr:universal stress protein [Natronococcus sp. CG52]
MDDPDAAKENNDAIAWVEEIEGTTYEKTDATAMTRKVAEEFTADVVDDIDVNVDIETAITDEADIDDEVLSTAERLGCDHVFIVGRKRSPTGKAIFGDVTQRVLLNFDGSVTVMME